MFSITNLSWHKEDEDEVLKMLQKNNFNYVELSLTKLFNSWNFVENDKIINYKQKLKNYNLRVSSLQSIFYGLNCNLFIDNKEFIEHFKKIIDYANVLEANYIVFGSPKNRKLENISKERADEIFLKTFSTLSEYDKNMIIGIETNPSYYNCNYITNYDECKTLMERLNKENVKFHLDTACLNLEGDNYQNIFDKVKNDSKLVHISTKDLKNIFIDLELINFIKNNYRKDVIFSIEMLNQTRDELFYCLNEIGKLINDRKIF